MDEFYEGFDSDITPTDVTANDGNIRIASDVISTIAVIASEETPGVAGMYTSIPGAIAEKLGAKKNQTRGVKVELINDSVTVNAYIVIKYGFKIRQVCESVQESIKSNIETMTGMKVAAVNIHVEGVSFSEKRLGDDDILFLDSITEE